jgi:hypothetical protein
MKPFGNDAMMPGGVDSRALREGRMNDKRFWSGAVVAVTVVIAGASALPSLMMRPSAPTPVAVVAAQAAKPEPAKTEPRAELVMEPVALAPPPRVAEVQLAADPAPPQIIASEPQPLVPEPPAWPEPTILPEPLIEPVKPPEPPAEPRRIAEPVPAAAPVQAATPMTFPPVQPIGVASGGPAATVAPENKETGAKAAAAKPASRTPSVHLAQRKRSVRPAVYPIGEFLAWRR